MYRGNSKVLPVVLIVIVMIVAIFTVVAIGRALLNRNSSKPVDDRVSRALVNSDADHSVRMTVRGPIIADENFNSYQIEVSPIGRRMTTYKGYRDEVIEDTRLRNNTNAYVEFVHALSRMNFTKEIELSEEQNDVRGICPEGRLYTFEVLQAQSVIKEFWISSCRNVKGSFGGEAVKSRDLFLKQIPESSAMLRDLNLQ
jgi:hypothetical protein